MPKCHLKSFNIECKEYFTDWRSFLILEDGNATMLVLERRFDAFIFFRLILQIIDDETSACSSHDGHGIVDVGDVDAFSDVN
jgi:hypothetical protein